MVLQACPTRGNLPREDPGHVTETISELEREHIGILPEKLEDVAVETDIWTFLLKLQPRDPTSETWA